MFRQFAPKLWQCLFIAAAIQVACAKPTADIENPSGKQTKRIASSCVEALEGNSDSGVYQIYLPEIGMSLVYCMADPNNGLPWTVIQRRVDNSTDFYRDWAAYKEGFGNLNTNFFIGLEALHIMTTQMGPQELWVKLTAPSSFPGFSDMTGNEYYDHFAIGDESEKYPLNVLGAFSGDAGDSLSYHLGMKFTTRDQANNVNADIANCAEVYHGAWWYKFCIESNLNGPYVPEKLGRGINWLSYRDSTVSMKYVHMAIRPAKV